MTTEASFTADATSNIKKKVEQALDQHEREITPTRFDEIRAVLARLADLRKRGIIPSKKPYVPMTTADFEKIYRQPNRRLKNLSDFR